MLVSNKVAYDGGGSQKAEPHSSTSIFTTNVTLYTP